MEEFPIPEGVKRGNDKLCKLTDTAAAKLSALLTRQGRPNGALRLAVVGGGCSGLQYKMDLVDGPVKRDIFVRSHNVNVVMDPKSALFVSGSLLHQVTFNGNGAVFPAVLEEELLATVRKG